LVVEFIETCLCLAKVLAKIKVHPFSAGILVSVKFLGCGSQFCSAFLFGASPVFSKRFGQHKVFGLWSKEKMRVKSGQVGGVVFSSKGSGKRAGYPTKRAPDVWESARFTSIFLASGFSCSQTFSTLAHTRVTHTVGRLMIITRLGASNENRILQSL
jgi:hypothetical protein